MGSGAHQGDGEMQPESLGVGRLQLLRPKVSRLETALPILSHLFQLKSFTELEKVKELKLEELWLEGNPFCNCFLDHFEYIRYTIAAKSFSPSLPISRFFFLIAVIKSTAKSYL